MPQTFVDKSDPLNKYSKRVGNRRRDAYGNIIPGEFNAAGQRISAGDGSAVVNAPTVRPSAAGSGVAAFPRPGQIPAQTPGQMSRDTMSSPEAWAAKFPGAVARVQREQEVLGHVGYEG